ncbi:hypothetical protein FOT85_25300 [Klebsiella michiganensis]|nr:hypothetical protein [Klebsiella michiganensis]
MNVLSPVALTLTGATVLRGLVARTGPSSAASGETPVALTLTGATALRGLVARTGASSAASGKMPGNKSHFLIDLIPTQPDIF